MSQNFTDPYKAQNESDAKAPDFALVISGWPTIYTIVGKDYQPAGELDEFAGVRAWADLPVAAGAGARSRPEEGRFSIGELEIAVLDRVEAGARSLSELLAREKHTLHPSVGYKSFQDLGFEPYVDPALKVDASAAATSIEVSPYSRRLDFETEGEAYFGLECVHYNGRTDDEGNDKFTLTGCTRGFRLTSPTRHAAGARVYPFLPSLFRRRAFIYKGYQGLGLADWAPAFGGAIIGAEKRGPAVVFRMMTTTFHMHNDTKSVMFQLPKEKPVLDLPVLNGDYTIKIEGLLDSAVLLDPAELATFVVNIGGHWNVITGVQV